MDNNEIVDVLRLALKEGRLTGTIGFDDDIEIALIEAIKVLRTPQNKWHDLRKNPNDLPKEKEVLIAYSDNTYRVGSYYLFGSIKYDGKNQKFYDCAPIAWKCIGELKDE